MELGPCEAVILRGVSGMCGYRCGASRGPSPTPHLGTCPRSKETPVIVETAVELRARCAWGHVLASLGNPLHFSDSDIIAVLEYFHEPSAMSRTGGQCLLVSCSGP